MYMLFNKIFFCMYVISAAFYMLFFTIYNVLMSFYVSTTRPTFLFCIYVYHDAFTKHDNKD